MFNWESFGLTIQIPMESAGNVPSFVRNIARVTRRDTYVTQEVGQTSQISGGRYQRTWEFNVPSSPWISFDAIPWWARAIKKKRRGRGGRRGWKKEERPDDTKVLLPPLWNPPLENIYHLRWKICHYVMETRWSLLLHPSENSTYLSGG